jgi:hypothetical protein
MNNIERSVFDFVLDTLTNRPKDLNEKIDKYSTQDKKILLKIITEQKETVKNSKNNISRDSYNDLMNIYKWLEQLLENNVF